MSAQYRPARAPSCRQRAEPDHYLSLGAGWIDTQRMAVQRWAGVSFSHRCALLSRLGALATLDQQQRHPRERPLGRDIKEGFLWLTSQPLLRFMILMIGGVNLTAVGMNLLVVILAQQLHATAFALGLILAIGSVGGTSWGLAWPILCQAISLWIGYQPDLLVHSARSAPVCPGL